MIKLLVGAAGLAAIVLPYAFGQTDCRGGTLAGTVRDGMSALIPRATLTLDGNMNEMSGSDGRFRFSCVGLGPHRLSARAEGFAKSDLSVAAPHANAAEIGLQPESGATQVDVNGDGGAAGSNRSTGPTGTIA